jgi:hypothetical protein
MISKVFVGKSGRVLAFENGLKIGKIINAGGFMAVGGMPSHITNDAFKIDDKSLFLPNEKFIASIDKVLYKHVHECPIMQSYGLFQKGIFEIIKLDT